MGKMEFGGILLAVASFLIAIYFYPQLPDTVATHWNAQGIADGYSEKTFGAFLFPFLLVSLAAIFFIIPKIDPMKENYRHFRSHFDNFVLLLLVFLIYLQLITILWNLGYVFEFAQLLAPALAIVFYYAGVLIKNAKQNWFIGLRTPWTLSSESVWNKTHKIGGGLFKAFAVISLLGAFFPMVAVWLIIGPMLALVLWSFVYSYVEFQKEKGRKFGWKRK